MLNHKINSDCRQRSIFMETLQDKLKDIKNFSNWTAKKQIGAVTAAGMISGALLPIVVVTLPVAATGAAVALTLFFAVKAVEYGYEWLKWLAEKTVEGVRHTVDKIRASAVCVSDSVKRRAHLARDRISDIRNALAVAIYDDREKYEDRSEVKEAAAKRKGDRILKSSREMRNTMFYGDGTSNLLMSSSMNSARINGTVDSTAGLLGSEEHKNEPTSDKSKVLSLFRRNKASEGAARVKYQVFSEVDCGAMQSAETGAGDSQVVPLDVLVSPTTNGYGGKRSLPISPSEPTPNSSLSAPTGKQSPISFASPALVMLTEKGGSIKTQADLRRTGFLGKLMEPSTKMAVETDFNRKLDQSLWCK